MKDKQNQSRPHVRLITVALIISRLFKIIQWINSQSLQERLLISSMSVISIIFIWTSKINVEYRNVTQRHDEEQDSSVLFKFQIEQNFFSTFFKDKFIVDFEKSFEPGKTIFVFFFIMWSF